MTGRVVGRGGASACLALLLLTACTHKAPPPPPAAPGLIVSFSVDGRLAGTAAVPTGSFPVVSVAFSLPMDPATVRLQVGAHPVTSPGSWDAGGRTLTETVALQPYVRTTISLAPKAKTREGGAVTSDVALSVDPVATEPTSAGGAAERRPGRPLAVVIDNYPAAQPQSGLQDADMVFEYASEYSITRFTAVYFGALPPRIGPVRSCRMINAYLDWSFGAVQMCSGASVGTLEWLFGQRGAPRTPAVINDFDTGNHFFRVASRQAPYNLFTDAARAGRALVGSSMHAPRFEIAARHADVVLGSPGPPPIVASHGVAYTYDAASQTYLRFQHAYDSHAHAYSQTSPATPFRGADGRQIRVKNVVILHVPVHDAGWVEDENGGAHSLWYDLLGGGPAEIWSDGSMLRATWHVGAAGLSPRDYWRNDQATWFSDASGTVVPLNDGLTWIHVVAA